MLTTDQISTYRQEGYLVVEDVVTPELTAVRAEYSTLLDVLCDAWGVEGDSFEDKLVRAYRSGFDWFQPMDISLPGDRIQADTPMHMGDAVFAMMTAPKLLDLVEDLIGPEITSNPIQHVRIKPPERELHNDEVRAHVGGTAWHQDRGVALEEADETDMVTIWIAVTDATPENGCLQVQPLGRDRTMLPHCPLTQTAIPEAFLKVDQARPLPVKAGGVVVLDPMVPHASLPNLSDAIRWSFDLRYSKTGQPTGRAHFPDFVARSQAAPETELRDPEQLRKMWRDARQRLAATPHIDIHRWRSDAPHCA